MDIIQVVFLSIVQGLTEFLPISSSAHLILVPKILGWEDQGLAFDVAVHVGTLLAVLLYFKSDIITILQDFWHSLKVKKSVGQSNLVWLVAFATVPAGLAGLFFNDMIELYLRSPFVIAFTTIFFGLLLWKADFSHGVKPIDKIGIKEAVLIGLAQALALIPGTSRSGITITAALFLGFDRTTAAKFSFLLSIPIIILAGGLKILELIQSSITVDWAALVLGVVLSAISAYSCIFLFLKFIEKSGMLPFVIYRLLLGIFLLIIFI